MADTKVSALTADTSVVAADLMYIVDDVGGTPTSKQITFDNVQKSLTVLGGASGVATQGDLVIPQAKYFYIGTESSDGSWRFRIDGTQLLVETREAGTWNEKGAWTA